jgi:hypothetical protein
MSLECYRHANQPDPHCLYLVQCVFIRSKRPFTKQRHCSAETRSWSAELPVLMNSTGLFYKPTEPTRWVVCFLLHRVPTWATLPPSSWYDDIILRYCLQHHHYHLIINMQKLIYVVASKGWREHRARTMTISQPSVHLFKRVPCPVPFK